MKESKWSHIRAAGVLFLLGTLTYNSSAAPGDLDLSFDPGSGVNASVSSIAVQSDGKIIIGGGFSMVRGLMRRGIARLNTDGSGDQSFDAGLLQQDGTITLALQSDGKVLAGNIQGITRLNADGSLDTNFIAPQFPNYEQASVDAIIVQPDGKILIGGGFYFTSGTNSYNSVVRLNSDGTLDSTFKTSLGGVSALALQPDGKVLAGASFGLVRLNANGSLDNTFTLRYGLARSIVLQPDGKVLIGGDFRTLYSWDPSGVARLNTDGTLDPTFARVVTNTPAAGVLSVALQSSGKILVGGYFIVNGANRRLARLNSDGTFDATFTGDAFASDASRPVRTIVLPPDGKPLIGGEFTTVNGAARHRIARLNSDGSLDNSFDPGSGVDGLVARILVQPNGKILIGGEFRTVKNVSSSSVARLNTDGSGDTSFIVDSLYGYILSLALQSDGKALVAGQFSSGQNRVGLARLHTNGSLDISFNAVIGVANGPEDNVFATAVAVQPDGKVLVAGYTEDYQCDPEFGCDLYGTYFLSRLNTDGSPDTNFNTTADGLAWVRVIALQPDGKVLIGGQLNDGTKEVGILRLNANGSRDNSFNASAVHIAHSMALQPDGKILFGGSFRSGNGTPRLARLNSDGTLDTSFGPGTITLPSLYVSSIALQPDGEVLAAGTSAQGFTARDEVARFNADGTLDNTFNVATVTNGGITSVALQADGNVLVGGWFRNISGVFRPYLARLYGSATSPSLSIARSGSSLTVSWPAAFGNFQLQENTNVALTNGWSAVAAPRSTNNTSISVAIPTTGSRKFFRLSLP